MSRRRLERAGKRHDVGAGVPVELGDPDDPVWQDADAVADLASRYGVERYQEPEPSTMRSAQWRRFNAFRRAYAESHGLMSERWPWTMDHHRRAAAGIYTPSRAGRTDTVTGR
jgi:hypothetical protein